MLERQNIGESQSGPGSITRLDQPLGIIDLIPLAVMETFLLRYVLKGALLHQTASMCANGHKFGPHARHSLIKTAFRRTIRNGQSILLVLAGAVPRCHSLKLCRGRAAIL